jgi:hypothetical protein
MPLEAITAVILFLAFDTVQPGNGVAVPVCGEI